MSGPRLSAVARRAGPVRHPAASPSSPCAGAEPPPARRAAPPCAARRPAEAELGQGHAHGPRALRLAEAVGCASAAHTGSARRGHGPRPACQLSRAAQGPCGSAPLPRRIRAPEPSRRQLAEQRHHAPRRRPAEAELGQGRARGPRALRPAEAVGRASAAHTGSARRGHGPRPALGSGRERFRPCCTRLNFINFSFVQFVANSKICVGFIRTRKIMKQILLERFKSVL
jgi:hypothetical protein